jgi:ABC-type histidine transport system ATPase subunit
MWISDKKQHEAVLSSASPMIIACSIFSVMAHVIPTTKKPRRGALYTREEIQVISKHKEEYKDQTTRALRAHVFRTKILVDIFNYWDEKGTLPSVEEASIEWVKVNNKLESVKLKVNSLPRNLLPGCEITGVRLLMLTNPFRP